MVLKRLIRINFTKLAVCLIGIIHAVLLYFGIDTTVKESLYYEKNDDLQFRENIEGLVLYGVHIIMIVCLFYSICKNAVIFLLPWLFITFLPFIYMTFMAIRGIKHMRWYLVDDLILNFIFVGICWLFWCIIFLIYRNGDFRKAEKVERIYDIFANVRYKIIKDDR
ncbi:unnamed protein product [Diabrotica balteata]|uniref:Uncharacterized protein n=1 Tax=Diabrotica balteata TaxID=107213 RepID=A0A9N9SZ11_DIABA|nr:unnamed protein product [Diabrotica balteata]